MQIGADIYCDTALIVRELEARYRERSILPEALAGAAGVWEDWADHRLFMLAAPPTVVDLMDALPPGFFEDRSAMTPGFSKENLLAAAPHAYDQLCHAFDTLNQQLSNSDYILGDRFTLADAACFHVVRFAMNSPRLAATVNERTALGEWVKRVENLGPGEVEAMTGAEALALAKRSSPAELEPGLLRTNEYAVDDEVTIIADDYGQETTTGVVTRIRQNDVTVLRQDPELGGIAVHYPRAGYRISR